MSRCHNLKSSPRTAVCGALAASEHAVLPCSHSDMSVGGTVEPSANMEGPRKRTRNPQNGIPPGTLLRRRSGIGSEHQNCLQTFESHRGPYRFQCSRLLVPCF